MAEFNAFDADRFLKARLIGAQRPRKVWLGAMFRDLAAPPLFRIIPKIPTTHSPPAGKAEGE